MYTSPFDLTWEGYTSGFWRMTLHSVFAVVSPGSGFYFAKKPGYQRRFAELINLMYLACDARAWHEQ